MADIVYLRRAFSRDDALSLFHGRCGHQWVGASAGSFACPVCGAHDGDHHLISVNPIPVQVADLAEASDAKWRDDTIRDGRCIDCGNPLDGSERRAGQEQCFACFAEHGHD
jgi:hypothetical protein